MLTWPGTASAVKPRAGESHHRTETPVMPASRTASLEPLHGAGRQSVQLSAGGSAGIEAGWTLSGRTGQHLVPAARPARDAVMPSTAWLGEAPLRGRAPGADTAEMRDRNVLGGELQPCGTDPVTGFYRDGCCTTGPEDLGSHTICAVVTAEFLEHQRRIGNDLSTPMPQFRFPGLVPGDRWCVTAANWLQAHRDGAAAPVVLASTHQRALEIVPLEILKPYSVDVPADLGALEE